MTRTTSTNPWKFFQPPHRPIEQSVLHRHLIILRIYPVAAFKSVTSGINLSDFTVQRHAFARRLLLFCSPSLSRNIFENHGTLTLIRLKIISRFRERFWCSYFLNKLLVAQRIQRMINVTLESIRHCFFTSWFYLCMRFATGGKG